MQNYFLYDYTIILNIVPKGEKYKSSYEEEYTIAKL